MLGGRAPGSIPYAASQVPLEVTSSLKENGEAGGEQRSNARSRAVPPWPLGLAQALARELLPPEPRPSHATQPPTMIHLLILTRSTDRMHTGGAIDLDVTDWATSYWFADAWLLNSRAAGDGGQAPIKLRHMGGPWAEALGESAALGDGG